MNILNLVNEDASDIKYQVYPFPDGQQQVVIKSSVDRNIPIENGIPLSRIKNFPITIKARLNNFRDLELIVCATKSLRNLGVKEIHLYTPYFLGSRSDRQFEEGSNNYLKDVICPIINSLEFESVTVLDPHSDVLEACLNNFKKESNLDLVKFALINAFKEKYEKRKGNNPSANNYVTEMHEDFILVSPDAGASKKIYKLAEQIGYKGDIITCTKDRDAEGKLTKTVVPINDLLINTINNKLDKDFIIIDDICDGGTTFINIAKEIKEKSKNFNIGKIYLIVTHSIQPEGIKKVLDYYDAVYTTNSVRDWKNIHKSESYHHLSNKIKVLNIF